MLLLEDSGKTNKVTMEADVTKYIMENAGKTRGGGGNRRANGHRGERLECGVSSARTRVFLKNCFSACGFKKSPCVL